MLDDAELLRRYVEEHSETAFSELVRRHVDVVYAAALRQTHGDAPLAQEVGQRVFTQLARKAATLARHPILLGWLHRTTRYAAIDAVRARARRQRYEREAEAMTALTGPGAGDRRVEWERLQPLIDEALDGLNEADRTAVLLRFFEGRSFAELGAGLGVTENTARMRVERALDKLRRRLAARGCTSTAAALGTVLAGEALAAPAPASWAATIAPAAISAAATGGGVAFAGASILTMNKLTVALITGIAAAALTTAGLNWRTRWIRQENAVLRAENNTLRQLKAAHAASENGAGPALGEVADRNKLSQLAALVQERNAARKAAAAASAPAKRTMQNRGNGAPMEAIETFAWACLDGDARTLAKQIYFEDDARRVAERTLAELPEGFRTQFKTPEELYGFFVAADALVAPPPSDPELLSKVDVVFLKSDRIEMRVKGSSRGRQQYQWTTEGWKLVFTVAAAEGLANNVLRNNPLPTGDGGML